MLDYTPLWETMQRKGISQYALIKAGIDNKTLDTLKKGNNITLLTVEKICAILDCTPNDIMEVIPDNSQARAEQILQDLLKDIVTTRYNE